MYMNCLQELSHLSAAEFHQDHKLEKLGKTKKYNEHIVIRFVNDTDIEPQIVNLQFNIFLMPLMRERLMAHHHISQHLQ